MSKRTSKPSLRERIERDRLFQLSADLPRIVELDVDVITPNPEQPRVSVQSEDIEELKLSISRHGLLQPILVQRTSDNHWLLVAGQRRLTAIRSLEKKTVPAIIVSGDPGELALVENLQRMDLNPFEEASAVARLMERHGYDQTEVGAVLGKKQNTVSALLAINRLPDEIKNEHIEHPNISRSILVELAQISDERIRSSMWQKLKAGPLTVRALRDERKKKRALPVSARVVAERRIERFVSAGEAALREIDSTETLEILQPILLERLQKLHKALSIALASYISE